MKKRSARQELIRSIVREKRIKTQQDLVSELAERGFVCTQATVSRDISDLGLRKLPEGVYVLHEDLHLQRMVRDLVVEVAMTGSLVLIKAQAGTAPGVAAALDDAHFEGILGSVSGDDTILVVTQSDDRATALHDQLIVYMGAARKQ